MEFGLDVRPSLSRPTGVGTYVLGLLDRLPALAPDDRFTYFSASFRERYPPRAWLPNAPNGGPAHPCPRAERGLEPPRLAADRPAGGPHARPRPLADAAPDPGEARQARRHDPRPLLPQASGPGGGRDAARLRVAGARPREARRRRHLRLRVHGRRGAAPARRSRRQDRGHPPRRRPDLPRDARRGRGRRDAAPAAAAARRHPVRRQRREAEEPRDAGDGLHDARPAQEAAAAAARARRPRLRLGAGRQLRGPADRRDRLPRARRRPRADGRVLDARAALARGGLRPAGGRGDGRGAAGGLLARLGARRGRGRRREPRGSLRRERRSRTRIERMLEDRAQAAELRARGLERSRAYEWTHTAERTLAFYRKVLGR